MLPIVGFIVWHDNGTVYRSDDCAWTDIPQQGAQIVAYLHDGGLRTYVYGVDTYTYPGETYTLDGRWMPTEDWEALRESVHAADAPDLPPDDGYVLPGDLVGGD